MNEIAGIPYSTVQFNEKGICIKQPAVPLDAGEVIIVSHGWNNDAAEAEALYRELFSNFASLHVGGTVGIAIVGVIWPSKKFDFSDEGIVPSRGAAVVAASTGGLSAQAQRMAIERAFAEFKRVFEDSDKQAQLEPLRMALARIDDPTAQREFVGLLRTMVQKGSAKSDFDGSDFFFGASDPRDVFVEAKQASSDVGNSTSVSGGVSAAGLGDVFSGIANAVGSLLNITTYYEMKARAGIVGETGVAPLIDQIAQRDAVRHIHLVGHSFGARLVAAAAMKSMTPKLHSLSLLQAAFSHNSFSPRGYFRSLVESKRLSGPIIVTHTPNDKAVGKAYAIASRISGDISSGLGDADDKYGGLGRNGAVNMAPAEVSRVTRLLLKEKQAYTLDNQIIHNLESSAFIHDHGDVRGKAVAWAISQAIATEN